MYTTVSSWIGARHEAIKKWTKNPVQKEEDYLVITALESLLNNEASGSATAKMIKARGRIRRKADISGHKKLRSVFMLPKNILLLAIIAHGTQSRRVRAPAIQTALLSCLENSRMIICQTYSCLRWTYRQFNGASISLAEGLAQRISRPGSRIVTLIPNSVQWLMLLSASIISKNAIACLDANMLNKPRHDELRAKIIDLQPYVIVVENAESVDAAEQALGSLDLQDVVKVSLSDKSISSNSGSWLPFADLCSPVTDQAASARIEDARYDDLDRDALIVYTSGTSSGIPKGCIRDVRGWIQKLCRLPIFESLHLDVHSKLGMMELLWS
ncbi:acetyl-CoA synthetase-like protein, partial [Aureobasidium melanogenum]